MLKRFEHLQNISLLVGGTLDPHVDCPRTNLCPDRNLSLEDLVNGEEGLLPPFKGLSTIATPQESKSYW
jgi:hypothetical protein